MRKLSVKKGIVEKSSQMACEMEVLSAPIPLFQDQRLHWRGSPEATSGPVLRSWQWRPHPCRCNEGELHDPGLQSFVLEAFQCGSDDGGLSLLLLSEKIEMWDVLEELNVAWVELNSL